MNRFFPRAVKAVLPVAPLVSVLTIALICACIIGQSAEAVKHSALRLLTAVFLVHTGGFALGYAAARAFRYDRIIARTISIEVGMQNSGLGVVLARRHFADPLVAVPCAISSVFHSVIGSLLAGYWRLRGSGPGEEPGRAGRTPVCSGSIGYKFYSGFGGQVDFLRGAAKAEGGKPIITIPSTAKGGTISRVVPHLDEGAGVTDTSADVHYVVTEYGIANLHYKNVRERARMLINIAHPKFRDELEKCARVHNYL